MIVLRGWPHTIGFLDGYCTPADGLYFVPATADPPLARSTRLAQYAHAEVAYARGLASGRSAVWAEDAPASLAPMCAAPYDRCACEACADLDITGGAAW